jgi:hypothetical protein
MEDKRSASSLEMIENEGGKRQLSGAEARLGFKRPAWVSSGDEFV